MRRARRNDKKRSNILGRLINGVCILVLLVGALFFTMRFLENAKLQKQAHQDSDAYHLAMSGLVDAMPVAHASAIADLVDEITEAVEGAATQQEEEEETDPHVLYADDNVDWETLALFDMPVVEDVPLEPEERVIQPAFEQFYARNPDLIGWITCGGNVDYPMLWRDNSFYMDHDFDGKESNAGAIFLDERNKTDMSDSSLLIYGHNMRSGAMFGDLDKFRKENYVRENPIVQVHSMWEELPRDYAIFSLFDASMNTDDPTYIKITRFNFDTDEDKAAYIQALQDRSIFRLPIEVAPEDQIICLVTCSYSQDNGRFLIFARRLRDGETKESMETTFQQ